MKMSERVFRINHERAIDYLNTRERLYVFDGFAGWDPKYRLKIRIVCARAYHGKARCELHPRHVCFMFMDVLVSFASSLYAQYADSSSRRGVGPIWISGLYHTQCWTVPCQPLYD